MSFRIKLGGAWPNWRRAATTFQMDGGVEEWEAATERYFDATQEVVHVITGQLRDSGKVSVTTEGTRFVGEVEYSAPYAAEEFGRGGPHDALQRGWEMVRDEFPKAASNAIGKAVERAFG